MALYFNDRINEQQKEDPSKDTITFTYPWIITVEDRQIHYNNKFGTTYQFASGICFMDLTHNEIKITYCNVDKHIRKWNGTCHLSYNLYYDNNMRFLLYSSPKIKLIKEIEHYDIFKTPAGFMTKFIEAFEKRQVTKVVVFVELQLLSKYFYRPFDISPLNGQYFDEYPEDVENDYRFAFYKKSDFTIKCPDGAIPCCRAALNITSEFFKKHFKKSNDHELVVEHSVDVVKPIIIYLHTRCFQMPKFCDIDFGKRLLEAFYYFKVMDKTLLKLTIERSLCSQFIKENRDFDSVLRWTSLASRHSLYYLEDIIAVVIANKYYFKWQQIFPVNARNFENPLFLDIFGSESSSIFARIDRIYENSFLTNVILD